MNSRPNQAYFAVKARSTNAPKCAPVLVALVESYDDAIRVAESKNQQQPNGAMEHYASVHHG